MIIDSHVHYGYSNIFDSGITEKSLMESMEKNGVCSCIVQPIPMTTAEEAKEAHNNIYKLTKKYPKRIFGLVSINPHLPKREVIYEIEKCVKEYGFVGIKCHTIGHAVNPLTENGNLLFSMASKLDVVLNVHTGNGIAFACPSLNILRARQYPDLKIVLAHSGMHIFLAEAYVTAKECKNIYLETSWTPAEEIEWLVKELGSNKILMGSDVYNDSCYNQHIELEKYRLINLTEKEKEDCLFNNANNIFKLKL